MKIEIGMTYTHKASGEKATLVDLLPGDARSEDMLKLAYGLNENIILPLSHFEAQFVHKLTRKQKANIRYKRHYRKSIAKGVCPSCCQRPLGTTKWSTPAKRCNECLERDRIKSLKRYYLTK